MTASETPAIFVNHFVPNFGNGHMTDENFAGILTLAGSAEREI